MHIPIQAPPIIRNPVAARAGRDADYYYEDMPATQHESGVEASQSPCESLTGPARPMCFAMRYGISM